MKELWYRKPASSWEEVLPLGCGSLGAMIWGDPVSEKIGMNEETLWSGTGSTDPSVITDHTETLKEIREWIRDGQYEKAERRMEQTLLGEYTESYLPAGNLLIDRKIGQVENYRRSLCLDNAETLISFDCQTETDDGRKENESEAGSVTDIVKNSSSSDHKIHIEQRAFTSCPEKALFIRQTSSDPIGTLVHFESLHHLKEENHTDRGLCLKLQLPEHVDPNYLGERENAVIWGERGKCFEVQIHVLFTDGTVRNSSENGFAVLSVSNATELVLAVTIAGSNIDLNADWKEHVRRHRQDFQKLYERADLEMPGRADLPTDERLKCPDPGLYALYFQYGRYLLISSSRKGGLPATLQGIWSWQMRAPWSSNYTVNINLQMNYWPALSANLAECDEVYIDFIRRICESGKRTAAAFGCQGSCCGHNSDVYAHTYPVGVARGEKQGDPDCLKWAFYLMAEVWMDQEVYRYWQYHPDREFLVHTAFPLLRESVRFILDYLVMQDGYYVTSPSTSPENSFLKDGNGVNVSWASTMDMTMIRELFRNFRILSEHTELTEEDRKLLDRMKEKEVHLYPVHRNADGSVCEWFEEQKEKERGHRHVSHLYGMFPSDLWRNDNSMKEAVRKSLKNRMEAGGGHTGWSLAWILNLYTVLQDREAVEKYLLQMFERSTYPNLWDKHPPFQIDGNFGMTAAISYMLAEENDQEIRLLPCLPAFWPEGSVKGICLPGNRVVSFSWKDGKVLDHTVSVETYQ